MNSIKPFSKRFYFPLYYNILSVLSVLFCIPVGIYLLFWVRNITVGAVLLGISLFFIYLLYETTQTILVDEKGIALDSLLGELKRFSWFEIAGLKEMGFFSPGIKVVSHNGESIGISSTLGHYDIIIDLIRRVRKDLGEKPMIVDEPMNAQQNQSSTAADLEFTTPGWRWISIPIASILLILFFVGAVAYLNMLFIVFAGLLLLIALPVFVYNFLKEPVLITTKGNQITIRFRSETFRKEVKTNADNVKDICFNHQRIHSEYGTHPSTNLTIYFMNGSKVVAENFDQPDEEMYIRLCAWSDKYAKKTDKAG